MSILRLLSLTILLAACAAPPAPTPGPTPTSIGGLTPAVVPSTPPTPDKPPTLWLNYSSLSGRFTVQLPTTLSIQEMTSKQSIADEMVNCTVIVARDNGALWTVQYCDYPPQRLSQTSTTALLDSAQEQVLSAMAHKLTAQQDVSLAGLYPGRSVVAAIDMRNTNGPFDGVLQAHIFVAQNRVYTVAAKVYTETTDTRLSLVDPFLQSFSIDGN